MDANRSEQFLRQAARDYAERYGGELRREMEELEQSGVLYLAPKLDRRIKELTGRQRRTTLRVLAALAACLALLLLAPRIGRFDSGGVRPQSAASPAPETTAREAGEAEPEEIVEAPMQDAETGGGEFLGGEVTYELIPLSFELPRNLTVSEVTQDRGQSIYYLEDTWQDDIVLTLEAVPEALDWGAFTPLELEGGSAYAISAADYQVLAFEREEVLYTMTCRHDINTLVNLGRHIL